MNALKPTVLRALIIKDFCTLRVPIYGAIVSGIGCYVIAVAADLLAGWHWNAVQQSMTGPGVLVRASQSAIVVTAILAAVFGGMAIAGERADQTADFIALLPVTRGQIIVSKLAVCAFSMLSAIGFHLLILLRVWGLGDWQPTIREWSAAILILSGCICSLFGVAWLLGTFLRSAPMSACAAIAVTIGSLMTVGLLTDVHELRSRAFLKIDTVDLAVAVWLTVIGLISFFASSWYYKRRIAP
jgi:ABC-type transport system involved in multi-copper enzyme maturation permease subunit